MPALVAKLVDYLSSVDPAHAATYQKRQADFNASMKPELDKIAAIKAASTGLEVTATEPVFGYMAQALGFKMLNYDFQIQIMNDAEPTADETAAFEESLKSKTAKILFYNSQVTDRPRTAFKKSPGFRHSGGGCDRDSAARPKDLCRLDDARVGWRSSALVLNSTDYVPRLQISDLTITLGGNEILANVNATIDEGEFIGIFGPNGAARQHSSAPSSAR